MFDTWAVDFSSGALILMRPIAQVLIILTASLQPLNRPYFPQLPPLLLHPPLNIQQLLTLLRNQHPLNRLLINIPLRINPILILPLPHQIIGNISLR